MLVFEFAWVCNLAVGFARKGVAVNLTHVQSTLIY